MKHIQLLSFIFLLTFFVSCKKTNTDANSIKGVWELRHLVGGDVPAGRNPDYAVGNGNVWKFNNSKYQYYSNGQLSDSGSYTLTKGKSAATGRYMNALILNKDSDWKLYFEIKNNILTLYRGIVAADGSIETYERIENDR